LTISFWNVYIEAAKRAKWDKQLLPVPEPNIDKSKLEKANLKSGDISMPYLFVAKGNKPKTGWPLFICLHGGGKYFGDQKMGAHDWEVNSREWMAQIKFSLGKVYQPDGLYFIPRMADDRLGRWWHQHNIEIFTRMIRLAVLFNEVDPNRVYIMGISQGGYGSCHLAPFMADLFAAAGPMAGGMMTVTENLRNLPFRSDIGEKDTAYKRIILTKELHASIDTHRKDDPEGYENLLAIQKGRGHGIDYSKSPVWLAEHTRNPLPDRIVWRCHAKDKIYRDSFYWISLTKTPEKGEFKIIASLDKEKNQVTITAQEVASSKDYHDPSLIKPLTTSEITVHLNDDMLNLDQDVIVMLNGKQVFKGKVKRTRGNILRNIVKRSDLNYAFPSEVTVGVSE
jgi:hypothetical protein